MYPILYPETGADLTKNGLGALSDAISCITTEERNGAYETLLIYPANGLHFDEIHEGMLLLAKPNDISDPQLFRIYDISKRFDNNIEISAEHISYELNNYPVLPLEAPRVTEGYVDPNLVTVSDSPSALWDMFSDGDPDRHPIPVNGRFTFESDIESVKTITMPEGVISLRALLGAEENSMLNAWDGEFEFDNFRVIFHQNRGTDNGVTIKFGKNMTNLTIDISTEKMYTHVFPYAKKTTYTEPENDDGSGDYDEEYDDEYDDYYDDYEDEDPDYEDDYSYAGETVVEWVYAPTGTHESTDGIWGGRVFALKDGEKTLEEKYGFKKVKILDLTGVFEGDYDIKESDILEQCENYISTNKDIKRTKITITASFEPKSAMESKAYSEKLEKIGLCDTVRVVYPLYHIDEKLKVIKTEYDVLNERYKRLEIGDAKSSFATTIRDQYDI